jgi:hypothetical protein
VVLFYFHSNLLIYISGYAQHLSGNSLGLHLVLSMLRIVMFQKGNNDYMRFDFSRSN